MPRPLVVVESPAKAKTIAKFLGNEFDVRASVGHVADLPRGGLAVDVENGFKPTYELTDRGKQVVKDLRAALKDASELYLATDEDREGEAISWHLLEYLKPRVPVKRMVFHEITKSAIAHAVANPRGLDYGLIDAAETRRILDRLYGYEVSPVLWRKINRGLSAGRVQSPAVRLVVERERDRIAFVSASYWDLAALSSTAPAFGSTLVSLDGTKVATGKDFDSAGASKREVVVLDEGRARRLATSLATATFTVRSVDDKPYKSSPKAPFMTSTLQQEGGRKLRLGAAQVMRLAQGLYERGFITYMRTDNVSLSDEALGAVRGEVARLYGDSHLAKPARHYTNKVKNAQEAHEAIRPTTPLRTPEQVSAELNGQELALYRLIWQRTLASQMSDAVGTTVSVRLVASADEGAARPTECEFAAAGTTITFPGYRAVYVESSDEGESEDKEAQLPVLKVGAAVPMASVTPEGHSTTPPARYTEASLVKRLEELGIGRPSTWANTIQTIVERGYVWKKGNALVPTWTAFAVINLLDKHFDTLVDYAFTAELEDDLDAIARNELSKETWLERFYFGHEPGLKQLVETKIGDIDAAEVNTFRIGDDPASGEEIVVKPGRYGPYVKRGDDTASVPDDLAPDELTITKALELLAAPKSDEPIGEIDGYPVFAKTGRYGPYVQWGSPDHLPPGLERPKMASLFKTMTVERMTVEQAKELLSLPRTLGADPADGVDVVANNGRYGPYVQKGTETRSIDSEEQLLTITLDQALQIIAAPKTYRGRGQGVAKPPLREFGADPVSGRNVTAKEGRFGVYVTDGETNASITRGDRIESMTPERAYELLAARREANALKGDTPTRRPGGARKAPAKKTASKKVAGGSAAAEGATAGAAPAQKAPAQKAPAKKAPAKKAAAKKSVAKKAPAKKAPARKATTK